MRGAIIAAILFCGQLCSADVFVVTQKGVWRSSVSPSGPSSWERVIEFRDGDTVHLQGVKQDDDVPDEPDDPPVDGIKEQVSAISKKYLKDEREAIAVTSVVRLLENEQVDLTKARHGLRVAVEEVLAKSPAFPDNQFVEWHQEVSQLVTGDYTKAFLAAVDQGVLEAFDIPLGKLQTLGHVEAIGITDIIEIIKIIIELLKNLGIVKIP